MTLELGPCTYSLPGAWGLGRLDGFPLSGDILSPFGPRPLTPELIAAGATLSTHTGIDIPMPEGTPIVAPASGVVNIANNMDDGTGYLIQVLTDGAPFLYECYHLVEPARDYATGRDLAPGDRVERGMVIGHVGTTGRSTGNHLHFAVMDLSGTGVYVDPLPFFTPTITPPPPPVDPYPVPLAYWDFRGKGDAPWQNDFTIGIVGHQPAPNVQTVYEGRAADGREVYRVRIEDWI